MVAIIRRRALAVLVLLVLSYTIYHVSSSSSSSFLTGRHHHHPWKIPYSAFVRSSFNWAHVPQAHPVPKKEQATLPRGRSRKLPQIQFAFPGPDRSRRGRARERELDARRASVKAAFVKSWDSYKAKAWLRDELTPVSGTGRDTFGGWAATAVDALDTLWIMGLRDEFYIAATAVAGLDWAATRATSCNFFETTIRHLGGLLSAYDLSGEVVLLHKAVELGDMLYTAFDTPTRMPPFWLDFEQAKTGQLRAGVHDPSAAVASSCLEFTRLARLTGDDKYYDAIDRVTRLLERTQANTKLPGLWPTFFDLEHLVLDRERDFTLGALADSLYELLPKMHALLGGLDPVYERLYRSAMNAVKKHLLFRPMLPDQADVLFTGNALARDDGSFILYPEMQHLSCFVGGMFGLGGKLLGLAEHVEIGEKITRGCVWAYDVMPSGIMPEIFDVQRCPTLEICEWDETEWLSKGDRAIPKGIQKVRDSRYLLRPEAIESVFLMYRITGNEEYQDIAWQMFQAIQRSTETELAFSAILDVNVDGEKTQKADSMESFWLSETLKYFYLIFSPPDLISLDEYVLNTEAHPLRRPS